LRAQRAYQRPLGRFQRPLEAPFGRFQRRGRGARAAYMELGIIASPASLPTAVETFPTAVGGFQRPLRRFQRPLGGRTTWSSLHGAQYNCEPVQPRLAFKRWGASNGRCAGGGWGTWSSSHNLQFFYGWFTNGTSRNDDVPAPRRGNAIISPSSFGEMMTLRHHENRGMMRTWGSLHVPRYDCESVQPTNGCWDVSNGRLGLPTADGALPTAVGREEGRTTWSSLHGARYDCESVQPRLPLERRGRHDVERGRDPGSLLAVDGPHTVFLVPLYLRRFHRLTS
jgi:hypothetical protein